MPPNATMDTESTHAHHVIALCHVIMSCDEFKADTKKLEPILKVSAKNINRKIDSIVSPYGFTFKGGKMCQKSGDGDASTPSTPAKTNGNNSAATPKTPASRKKKDQTTAGRKRKRDDMGEEEHEVKEEYDNDDGAVA
ncbi:hypothetical protein F4779DRAFT_611805 [Xylariaceae sp. FL0662B]|nr:hypothetical protein F4779DRAFT_611805 [Xylariaceae sp. FL0662B]